jgi:hypothetical protein
MSVTNSLKAVPLTSIAASTLSGSYQLVTASSGLPNPVCILKIINNASVVVTVSYDGSTDHDFVRAGETLVLNIQTNSQPNNKMANMAKGTQVWVKGVAGTGTVYVAAYYLPVVN